MYQFVMFVRLDIEIKKYFYFFSIMTLKQIEKRRKVNLEMIERQKWAFLKEKE